MYIYIYIHLHLYVYIYIYIKIVRFYMIKIRSIETFLKKNKSLYFLLKDLSF